MHNSGVGLEREESPMVEAVNVLLLEVATASVGIDNAYVKTKKCKPFVTLTGRDVGTLCLDEFTGRESHSSDSR